MFLSLFVFSGCLLSRRFLRLFILSWSRICACFCCPSHGLEYPSYCSSHVLRCPSLGHTGCLCTLCSCYLALGVSVSSSFLDLSVFVFRLISFSLAVFSSSSVRLPPLFPSLPLSSCINIGLFFSIPLSLSLPLSLHLPLLPCRPPDFSVFVAVISTLLLFPASCLRR